MRLLAIEPTAEPKVFASPPQSAERWTGAADPREARVAAAAAARVAGSARLTAETVTGPDGVASGMEPDQGPDPPDAPPVEPETGRTGNGGVDGREPKARRWTGGGVAEVEVLGEVDEVVVVGAADAADGVVPAAAGIGAGTVGFGNDVGVSTDRWIGIAVDVGVDGIGAVADGLGLLVLLLPGLLVLVVPGVAGAECVVVLRSRTGARWTVGAEVPGGANPGIDPGSEPKDVGPEGSGWTDDGLATGARPANDGNATGVDPAERPILSGTAARCTGAADDGGAEGADGVGDEAERWIGCDGETGTEEGLASDDAGDDGTTGSGGWA